MTEQACTHVMKPSPPSTSRSFSTAQTETLYPLNNNSLIPQSLLVSTILLSALICLFYVPHFGEGNGTPLQYSCLENPMGGRAWSAAVHGVSKSQTRLNDFAFTFHFHAMEKEMATHSSTLAWRIPGTGEPGGLPSMGSHRVGHDWSDLAAAAAAGTSFKWIPVIIWLFKYLKQYNYVFK